MPYYVYKMSPGVTALVKNLEAVDEFAAYAEAKKRARALRSAESLAPDTTVKIVFAESRLEAEELLQEKRDKPILKEWEK